MTTIGLDVGTSALKAIAVGEKGEVIASASREYPLYTEQPQWAEQDGRDFEKAAIEALGEIVHALGSKKESISAIGLTGQMHSAMLSANGKLLRRAILWCDTRTSEECKEITRAMGIDGLRRTVKNLALEGFTLPKLLWVRKHEPDVFWRTKSVVMPKDWIGHLLTGVLETDVSDASGTLVFDPEARTWSKEILDKMTLDASIFPKARESFEPLGNVLESVSSKTGIPKTTVVVRGGADNAAGAVGLGVVREGRAMASIGTSGVVLAHTKKLHADSALRLHAFCASVPSESYAMVGSPGTELEFAL